MAHIRLRKFNTRDVYPDQDLDNDLSMVVRAGNRIFLRGQTAMDLDGVVHGIGDPAAQAENAMACVKRLLEEAGSRLEHEVVLRHDGLCCGNGVGRSGGGIWNGRGCVGRLRGGLCCVG